MDVLDFINRNGQRVVPNPNYNPKSKKNKEKVSYNVHLHYSTTIFLIFVLTNEQ